LQLANHTNLIDEYKQLCLHHQTARQYFTFVSTAFNQTFVTSIERFFTFHENYFVEVDIFIVILRGLSNRKRN
jgi:hypothetical protein